MGLYSTAAPQSPGMMRLSPRDVIATDQMGNHTEVRVLAWPG